MLLLWVSAAHTASDRGTCFKAKSKDMEGRVSNDDFQIIASTMWSCRCNTRASYSRSWQLTELADSNTHFLPAAPILCYLSQAGSLGVDNSTHKNRNPPVPRPRLRECLRGTSITLGRKNGSGQGESEAERCPSVLQRKKLGGKEKEHQIVHRVLNRVGFKEGT